MAKTSFQPPPIPTPRSPFGRLLQPGEAGDVPDKLPQPQAEPGPTPPARPQGAEGVLDSDLVSAARPAAALAEHPPAPQPLPAKRAGSRQPGSSPSLAARGTKRVSLYATFEQWKRLKQIGIERAEQGLPDDLSSIMFEALDEKYRRR